MEAHHFSTPASGRVIKDHGHRIVRGVGIKHKVVIFPAELAGCPPILKPKVSPAARMSENNCRTYAKLCHIDCAEGRGANEWDNRHSASR